MQTGLLANNLNHADLGHHIQHCPSLRRLGASRRVEEGRDIPNHFQRLRRLQRKIRVDPGIEVPVLLLVDGHLRLIVQSTQALLLLPLEHFLVGQCLVSFSLF